MNFDIIIIGGGIIGCATAYHIQQHAPDLKIAILEQFPKFGMGNTRKSAALYRNIFGSRTARTLAGNSIMFYESIAQEVTMKPMGYLWLFSGEKGERIKKEINTWNSELLGIKYLSSADIFATYPLSQKEGKKTPKIECGLLGTKCGAISAPGLTKFYAHQFLKRGGKILVNRKIKQFHFQNQADFCPPWKSHILLSVEDSEGTKYSAKNFLFATGAWSAEILTKIGIAPLVYPKKRRLYSVKLPKNTHSTALLNSPAIILPMGGVYLKPIKSANLMVIGGANQIQNPYIRQEESPIAEEEYYNCVIRPILKIYVPEIADLEINSKWAGYYSTYWPDSNPVIESIENCTWVSGTSGSGIMKADSIGRIAAGKILGFTQIPLFSGEFFTVSDLSIKTRRIDAEFFVI